jgi:ectoine hydroxylase-related dioxygenase (phytanoyl-CoA dioxygenase family)
VYFQLDSVMLDARKIEHCYRPGEPVVFDARLIHGVCGNTSSRWRVLIWSIFDQY